MFEQMYMNKRTFRQGFGLTRLKAFCLAAVLVLAQGFAFADITTTINERGKKITDGSFSVEWEGKATDSDGLWYVGDLDDSTDLSNFVDNYLRKAKDFTVSKDADGWHFTLPSCYDSASTTEKYPWPHNKKLSFSGGAMSFTCKKKGEKDKMLFTLDSPVTLTEHRIRTFTDDELKGSDVEDNITAVVDKMEISLVYGSNDSSLGSMLVKDLGKDTVRVYLNGHGHANITTVTKSTGVFAKQTGVVQSYPSGTTTKELNISAGGYDYLAKPAKKAYKKTDEDTGDCRFCKQPDSKIRFNDFYGEVKVRCNSEEDDAYEFAEFDTIIYENDRIKTEEDSGAILGLRDMSTFVIKPETIVIVDTEDGNINKLEMLIGCIIGNMKKTAEGKNLDFEMSECVAGRKGTIFALEETGSESKVYTFVGEMEVTSKKTGKKRSVMPGEFATVGTDGKINMQEFSIEQEAGRFGIPMEDITRHYEAGYVPVMSKGFSDEVKAAAKSSVSSGKKTSKADGKKKQKASKSDGNGDKKKKSKGKIFWIIVAVLLVLFFVRRKHKKPVQTARGVGPQQNMMTGTGMPGQPYGGQAGQPYQNMPPQNTANPQNMTGQYGTMGQPYGGQGQPGQYMPPPQNMGGYGVFQCPYCGTQLAAGTRFCTGCGSQLY